MVEASSPFGTWMARLLKVPPQPEAPAGSAGAVRLFRAATNYYRYRIFTWAVTQTGALAGVLFGASFFVRLRTQVPGKVATILTIVEILGIAIFILQVPLTFAILRLDYEMRWYLVTDRALRIREGVMNVREKTMTFANIQNMTIHQGPVQRLLGIADLEVQSAGGGASKTEAKGKEAHVGESLHTASFRGVDRAAEIRELIQEAARRYRDSGLGDPDEPVHADAARNEEPLAAAQALLDEVRALRAAMSGAGF